MQKLVDSDVALPTEDYHDDAPRHLGKIKDFKLVLRSDIPVARHSSTVERPLASPAIWYSELLLMMKPKLKRTVPGGPTPTRI